MFHLVSPVGDNSLPIFLFPSKGGAGSDKPAVTKETMVQVCVT